MDEKEKNNILKTAAQFSVPEIRSKEEVWRSLGKKITEQPITKTIRFNPYLSLGIAASIALAVAAYLFLIAPKKFTADRAQHLSIVLPDQSGIIMNAESEIKFKPWNWGTNRLVELKGEAFFEVEPGSSFIVKTQMGTVHVTGTSFNIYQRKGKFEVSCFTGSVQVRNEYAMVKLSAGEKTTREKDSFTRPTLLDKKLASWKNGDFYFENSTLQSVTDELGRQFDIDIILPPTDRQRKYTGYFNSKNLDEALNLVFSPMGLSYKKEAKKIIVA